MAHHKTRSCWKISQLRFITLQRQDKYELKSELSMSKEHLKSGFYLEMKIFVDS